MLLSPEPLSIRAFSRTLAKSSQSSKSPAFPCEMERRLSPGIFVQQQGLVSLWICMRKLGFPPVTFSKFSSLSSQNICVKTRSKVEGKNYLLYHKHPNSCICQEKRIAFVSQAEVSFFPTCLRTSLYILLIQVLYACCSHYCALFLSVEFLLGHL